MAKSHCQILGLVGMGASVNFLRKRHTWQGWPITFFGACMGGRFSSKKVRLARFVDTLPNLGAFMGVGLLRKKVRFARLAITEFWGMYGGSVFFEKGALGKVGPLTNLGHVRKRRGWQGWPLTKLWGVYGGSVFFEVDPFPKIGACMGVGVLRCWPFAKYWGMYGESVFEVGPVQFCAASLENLSAPAGQGPPGCGNRKDLSCLL